MRTLILAPSLDHYHRYLQQTRQTSRDAQYAAHHSQVQGMDAQIRLVLIASEQPPSLWQHLEQSEREYLVREFVGEVVWLRETG